MSEIPPVGPRGISVTRSTATKIPAARRDSSAWVTSPASAAVEALAAFSQAKHVAALDTLYAPDPWVRIVGGSGVNRGWVDYRDHHLGPELGERQNFRSRYDDIEPQVRGDVAWAAFRHELVADTSQGHVEVEGRGTAILEQRGGRWLVVHTYTSGRRRVP